MSVLINATPPGAAQQLSSTRPTKAHHEPKNNSSRSDNIRYRANVHVHPVIIPARLNLVKSQLRSLLDQDETRRFARIAVTWLIRAVSLARLFRALVRALTRIVARPSDTDWTAVGGSGFYQEWSLRWNSNPDAFERAARLSNTGNGHKDKSWRRLLVSKGCASPITPTPGQILKQAAERKEAQVVVQYATAGIQPATPVITPMAPTHSWAGKSDTPGIPETISTRETAATLAAARKAGSLFLIDGSRTRAVRA